MSSTIEFYSAAAVSVG